MNGRVWIAFGLAAALGAAVWALSVPLTGKAEPWDSEGPYYFIALALAGAASGASMRGHHLLAQYAGAVVGQAAYEVVFLEAGPLFVLGLAFLLGYATIFLGAAALGGLAGDLIGSRSGEGDAKPRVRRLLPEALLVALAAAAFWLFLYNPRIGDCCGPLDEPILWVVLSSFLLGSAFVGAGHDRIAVLIGIVIEALAVWAIVRAIAWAVKRRNAAR